MVDSLDFATGEVNLIQLSHQMTSLGAAMRQQTETNNCRVELVAERLRKRAGKPPEPPLAEEKVFESLSVVAAAGVLMNALTIAPGLLSAAADIFGYFQTTDTFKSVEVTMNAAALRAAVAGALRHKPDNTPSTEHSVIMADYHVLKEGDKNQGTQGIMAMMRDCLAERVALSASMAALKGLPDAVAKLTNAGALDKEIEAQLKLADMEHARGRRLPQPSTNSPSRSTPCRRARVAPPWRQRPFASSWIRKHT